MDKSQCFDELKALYYNKNFGTTPKAEIDLLMFRFYLEDKIAENLDDDNVVDYSKISDFKIAKELGLTPQKVKNLKIKVQMKYPNTGGFDWQKSFRKILANSKNLTIENGYIKISIPDPNVKMELEEFLNDRGTFANYELNSKLLSIKKSDFLDLFEVCGIGEDDKEKFEEELRKSAKAQGIQDVEKLSALEIIEKMANVAVDVTQIIKNICDVFSPASVVGSVIKSIVKAVKG